MGGHEKSLSAVGFRDHDVVTFVGAETMSGLIDASTT
jgi:hypothetical protein